MTISKQKIRNAILYLFAFLSSILANENIICAQTIPPPSTISIYLSSEWAPIYYDFEISWKCSDPSATVPEYQLQTRYKLDVPGDWMGGIKYNINKWTDYIDGNTGRLLFSDFIIEGTYKISVQCRNTLTGQESKVFSKTFHLFWEYPEIQEEAFTIDWNKVNNAINEQEKYRILAEEYKQSYLMWNQKFQYELNVRNATISSDELIEMYALNVGQELTEDALISLLKKSSQNVIKQILLPKNVYDMIKLGAVDIILIFRRYHIDKALNMASTSYKAWKLFEEKSYSARIKFIKTLKVGLEFDTIIYANENKIRFLFEPFGNIKDNLWTEMLLWINYKEYDLYGPVQHGPGFNQVGMWVENKVIDFTDESIIMDKNIHLKTKLIKTNLDRSKTIEIQLDILSKPKELKQIEASFTKMGAGDLVHVFFKQKDSNEEFDFWPTYPEDLFIIANENLLKNYNCMITYIAVDEDLGPALGWSEPNIMTLNKITNIKTDKINLNEWWSEVLKDNIKKKRYENMREEYIQSLW
jgi:hypothetical protein